MNSVNKYWFDCSECDFYEESETVLDEIEHNEDGDAICPECGGFGVIYDLR